MDTMWIRSPTLQIFGSSLIRCGNFDYIRVSYVKKVLASYSVFNMPAKGEPVKERLIGQPQ